MSGIYEVYAIRYATMTPRTPQMNYLQPDPHENAADDLDCFVWLIRGNGRNIVVDTGFNEAAAQSRSRYGGDSKAMMGLVGRCLCG
jgi:glyoxylase-like metal-dependent hydrolase (beta-lactamase superfamily II)